MWLVGSPPLPSSRLPMNPFSKGSLHHGRGALFACFGVVQVSVLNVVAAPQEAMFNAQTWFNPQSGDLDFR